MEMLLDLSITGILYKGLSVSGNASVVLIVSVKGSLFSLSCSKFSFLGLIDKPYIPWFLYYDKVY